MKRNWKGLAALLAALLLLTALPGALAEGGHGTHVHRVPEHREPAAEEFAPMRDAQPEQEAASAPAEDDSEDALRNLLSESAGWEEFDYFYCADYDGDGSREAFALAGAFDGVSAYAGDLWFVSAEGAQLLQSGGSYSTLEMLGSAPEMTFHAQEAGSSISHSWTVQGGTPVAAAEPEAAPEEEAEPEADVEPAEDAELEEDAAPEAGVEPAEDAEPEEAAVPAEDVAPAEDAAPEETAATAEDVALEADTAPEANAAPEADAEPVEAALPEEEDAGGWMRYFYYVEDGALKEYGGIYISQDELLEFDGADEIIAGALDEGYAIEDIIYRDNGVINVNVERDGAHASLTLRYDDEAVHFWQENAGTYALAKSPEIAVYPAEFQPPRAAEAKLAEAEEPAEDVEPIEAVEPAEEEVPAPAEESAEAEETVPAEEPAEPEEDVKEEVPAEDVELIDAAEPVEVEEPAEEELAEAEEAVPAEELAEPEEAVEAEVPAEDVELIEAAEPVEAEEPAEEELAEAEEAVPAEEPAEPEEAAEAEIPAETAELNEAVEPAEEEVSVPAEEPVEVPAEEPAEAPAPGSHRMPIPEGAPAIEEAPADEEEPVAEEEPAIEEEPADEEEPAEEDAAICGGACAGAPHCWMDDQRECEASCPRHRFPDEFDFDRYDRGSRCHGSDGACAEDVDPEEDYPEEDYPEEGYRGRVHHGEFDPEDLYPEERYWREPDPEEDYPEEAYPEEDYPEEAYPEEDYPSEDYPEEGYPSEYARGEASYGEADSGELGEDGIYTGGEYRTDGIPASKADYAADGIPAAEADYATDGIPAEDASYAADGIPAADADYAIDGIPGEDSGYAIDGVPGAADYIYTESDANLRTGPGLDFDVLGVLPANVRVEYLGEQVQDARGVTWYYARYGSVAGWCSSMYARLVSAYAQQSSASGAEGSAIARAYAADDTNLRSGPGLNSARIAQIPGGTTVEYLGEGVADERGAMWYHVRYGGIEGWSASVYIIPAA